MNALSTPDPSTGLILAEISHLMQRIRQSEIDALDDLIRSSPRVMAFATGRSGFVLRAFIMRLNHLGQQAFFIGEASTPPVYKGDCFLVVSGTGTTATSLGAAMEAAKFGARIGVITGSRISPMGQLGEVVVEIPAPHKRGTPKDGLSSRQSPGSLFEQGAFLLMESLILRRSNEMGIDAHGGPLARHANLEA